MTKRLAISFPVAVLMITLFSSVTLGFSITEPKSGTIFHPGDEIVIKILAEPAENAAVVYCLTLRMPFSSIRGSSPYEFKFVIPNDFMGEDTIVAEGKLVDGTVLEAKVQIRVALPQNIILKSISVDPTFIFLQKMPQGSDANKIRAYETEDISVGGLYSDGIKRGITSSSSGTTYTSSNEKVVVVDREGNVAAQGIGTATITVRNGKSRATLKVVVKPYKPQE